MLKFYMLIVNSVCESHMYKIAKLFSKPAITHHNSCCLLVCRICMSSLGRKQVTSWIWLITSLGEPLRVYRGILRVPRAILITTVNSELRILFDIIHVQLIETNSVGPLLL